MIRCNNCGWFNPDTAKHCEMCDESLTGLPIENPVEQAAPKTPVQEPVPVKEPVPAKEPKVEKTATPASSNPMMETVRMASPAAPKPSFSATVMDIGAVRTMGEPVHCPKCRYPVYGFTETCPNCGSSLKKVMQGTMMEMPSTTLKDSIPEKKPEVQPAQPTVIQTSPFKGTVREAPVPGTPQRSPKATVREIPAALKMDAKDERECWRLIPVESPDPEIIVMKPGEIISIGNRRYKFQK